MKKKILTLSLALLVFASCQGQQEIVKESALRGTFTYNDAITTQFKKEIQDGDYLYCSIYPQRDMTVNQNILYRIDQRLVLSRDFTYNYQYSIILGNPGEWGNLEVARLLVDISGTFTYNYLDEENGKYIVALSNPTSGSEQIFGSDISANTANLGSWTMHAQADAVYDFSLLSAGPDYVYDQYVCARKVIVTQAQNENESNTVTDNIFYKDILDTFAHYSTY